MPTLVASKNTAPELIVQKIARELSLNFHTHRPDLPGRPDLVFYESRTVVFVHGCFWHGHSCRPAPQKNIQFWDHKRRANMMRDEFNTAMLKRQGWDAIVLWECEIADEDFVAAELIHLVTLPQ